MRLLFFIAAWFLANCSAHPQYNPQPYPPVLRSRQASSGNSSSLQVDLGYEVYEGYTNSTTGLNVWKGIRFAAPPTGSHRWQAPQAPQTNRDAVIQANHFGPICPQNQDTTNTLVPLNSTGSSEDCLFLNVYAPPNAASPLPVLFYIHGGGYGRGNGQQDLSAIINANNNSFVGVTIQYRLGAFGFLAGDEVFRNGVVNAGLLDQYLALQWAQKYISLFGGDPNHVTIAGQSAGRFPPSLQDMAYGGSQGQSLFRNTIASSPYLPMQYGYKDWQPSQAYYAFASMVGCAPTLPYGAHPNTIFECLVSQDSATLQNASATLSESGKYGTWAFLPVTDGIFVQDLPSRQLLRKELNGLNLLVSNNALEGPAYTQPNITTEDDLVAWLQLTFPLFTNDEIAKVLLYYPSSNESTKLDAPLYASSGTGSPSFINQSSVATGQQQRAFAIYSETTFVCPSYWMAEAYSDHGRNSFKYQYSVPIAVHGTDLTAYFGPPTPNQSPDFVNAAMKIWGSFITSDNPSIPNAVANGLSSNSTFSNPASDWPPFKMYSPYQINLNVTGGTPFSFNLSYIKANLTEYGEPGLVNNFTLVDAYTWEAGRGYRCDMWRSLGSIVPE
ncbi:carboxylesterase 2 [Cladophialophora psammophila CBS 110553]|uniref:Carboxylic ester hydrolase n=1 Tax=Cladophialophora psammophila CBS 110553 TaxID=1182543 RepID=W9WEK4_9EURO|nr:carboxylesterase 2 [Cladophialophora psammophila CBS 110553]EXJ66348.1 carboxylesterase 2 [Cladophialophora psammophila CBS 110553]